MKPSIYCTLTPRASALHAALFALPMLFAAAPASAAQFSVTKLGALGGTNSVAQGINAAGQVVGNASTSGYAGTYAYHAFLWQSGSMQDLGTLGGTYSSAHGINAAGQVVGWADTSGDATRHAVLWQSGSMQDLGTLGGTNSNAYGINAAGQVVGSAYTSGNAAYHAFLWQSGSMQDLGTLGGTYSQAYGINAAGQVVGSAYTSGNAAYHAFLWDSGSMTDLNSLIDPLSGWTIYGAVGINDSGQIAATGCDTADYCSALLLTPVPEPETYLMMLAGLALLIAKARRRKSAQ